jgi:hypothetical protein
MNMGILDGRKIMLRMLFQDRAMIDKVEEGHVEFSTSTGRFKGYYVIIDGGIKKPYAWWETHGAMWTIIQRLTMRLPLSSYFILLSREELAHTRMCIL